MPVVEKNDDGTFRLDFRGRPDSIGRVRAFHGNFGMMIRAYTYLREMGADGLRRATELAVLNANYLACASARRGTSRTTAPACTRS